nr:hypothetical protein [Tanacetum cinerariifolium]
MMLTFADTHNMIAYLTKSDASEGFDQIIDFLNASLIKYALTVNPNIYVLRIKQFGSSISVKKVNDVMRLQALIDRKKVIITKATIREALRLDDAESIDCLPDEEIFTELSRIGIRKGFSRVETPLFEGMIVAQQADDVAGEVDAGVDVDDVLGADVEPSLPSPTTQLPPPSQELPSTSYRKNKLKVSRLRRLRKVRTAQRIESSADTVMDDQEDTSKQREIIANIDVNTDVTLKDVVVVEKTAEIEENTDVQRRPEESQAQIYKIDLEHADKVLSMQDDELEPVELKEVVKVVTTAKLMIEVVTAAVATITAAPTLITDAIITTAPSIARRRKGVVIRDLEETATPSIIIHPEPKSKDRGKRIMVEEPKLLKNLTLIVFLVTILYVSMQSGFLILSGSGKKKKKKKSCMADQNLTAHARNFDIDISFPKLCDLMSKATTPDVVMARTNAASPVIMSSVLNSITKEGCGAQMVWLSLDSVHVINDKMKNSLIGKRLAFSVVECTSGADDEGFVEVKKTKSCGNNGGNKNFKLVSVYLKPQYRPKEKQSTKGANQKTTPSVGKKNDSTSRNGTFCISNLFEALNVENSVSEDVETGLEEECVLVDDDGKPLKNVDNLDDHSEDEIESVDNEMTSYLASKPSGVGYGLGIRLRLIWGDKVVWIKCYDVSDDEDTLVDTQAESQTTVKPSFKKIEFTKARNESLKSDKQADKLKMVTQNSKTDKKDWNGNLTQKLRISKEIVNTVRINGANTAGQTSVSTVEGNGVTAVNTSAGFVAFGGSTKGGKITATIDESNLWHRRLGHVNSKTMNKLEKGNLVRGLPLKNFENNHTCVACQKEKHTKPLAKAVNTTCYVLNRVLVTKPHNKTPYELIIGRPPSISFMRPFGCPVTILNTIDPLGKFDGKAEEEFLVRYFVNSKDFRVPSSIHVFQPSSFFDLEKDGVYMNRQNYNSQFDTGDGFYNAPPPVINSNIMDRQQQVCKESEFQYCDDNSQLLESVIYHTQKKMVNSKKDGHSKIHTAQGPRDRRVRLSIDVARKFFCLQDLLGFDKASKTLDWLFAKSKTAIKDLVEEMKHCSSSSATDQCEMVFQETIRKGSDEEDKYQRKKSETKFFDAKRKKMMRKYKSGVDVNQSRAEARARARERTKEKLHNKKHDEESKKITDNCYRPNHRLVLICPQPADTVISDYK